MVVCVMIKNEAGLQEADSVYYTCRDEGNLELDDEGDYASHV